MPYQVTRLHVHVITIEENSIIIFLKVSNYTAFLNLVSVYNSAQIKITIESINTYSILTDYFRRNIIFYY